MLKSLQYFYWFCVAFLIAVCIYLITNPDILKSQKTSSLTIKTPGVYINEV